MDPLTAFLIEFWPWVAGGFSSIILPILFLLLSRKTPEQLEAMRQELERKTQEREAEERVAQEERRQRQEARRRARAEEQAHVERRAKQQKDRIQHVVKEALQHIVLTAKRVQVGFQKVDERAIGIEMHEVGYAADHIDIRPIRDVHEVQQLLDSEHVLDDDLALVRIATGEAMVSVHLEEHVVTEDVFEPSFEQRSRVIYGLLDRSPSMYPREFGRPGGEAWRKPVWLALTDALVEKTIQEDADLLWREFGGSVTDLIPCLDEHQKRSISTRVRANTPISSTNIGRAIRTAIKDFDRREYDQAYILIITDGEDNNGTDWKQLRDLLDTRGIKLHAILLGVENEGLRTCAHVSQTITADLSIADLVHT